MATGIKIEKGVLGVMEHPPELSTKKQPDVKRQGSREGDSVISIEYADSIRFEKPKQLTFGWFGSICSVLSLLFMAGTTSFIYLQLTKGQVNVAEYALWTRLPFLFAIIGSVLGAVYEFSLLVRGRPFQLMGTKLGRFIEQLRFLNLAPVVATTFFFTVSMVIPDPNIRLALLYVSGAVGFGLAFALFFGGAQTAVFAGLFGAQIAQIGLVLFGVAPPGGIFVSFLLVLQAVLLITALAIGTATPAKSTGFHVVSTFSLISLFSAVFIASAVEPSFSKGVALVLPEGSLLFWGFVFSSVAGVLMTVFLFPKTYSLWREKASKLVWSVLYFFLVSAKRFPNPFNLSEVYDDNKPDQTQLKPYYIVHSEFLVQNLSIPAAVKLEKNVTAFKALLTKVKKSFSLIALLDHYFPQAKNSIPIQDKPRMAIWSDGEEYWPGIFTKNIFGYTIPVNGGNIQKAPPPAIEAYKAGQLLAYLTAFGVAATFAKRAEGRGEGALVSDLRFLEVYETKADYESYGGVAYFQVNSEKQILELVSVIAPNSTEEIPVNPDDATFRWAESQVLASLYYLVISGKHLAEIHMTYNLVEVSMHNAFDAQGQWAHPFRTFLYLHFFSHELAEELTTEHLVQDGAVFSQIFATTQDSLINHLNDSYHSFEYGEDENFEERAALMSMKGEDGKPGKILPNACISWELEYAAIWEKYTNSLIHTIYEDDQAVQNDPYLQDFHEALLTVLLNGLPERYENFKTRSGVARFASDTIHHCVIRHQVYGTTGVKAALDPRLNQVQVPCDGGSPAVDEWRSLAYVALATGRARFTLLMQDFTYLLKGVEHKYQEGMKKAFKTLQHDLEDLEGQWTGTEEDARRNYDYFRAIPSSLHTGPGY